MRSCCEFPRIKPNTVFATDPSLTPALASTRYGIAQKEQLGFDKAVEVRLEPPPPSFSSNLHDAHLHSPQTCTTLTAFPPVAWQECKYRVFAAASNRRHTAIPLDCLLTVLTLVCTGMSRYGVTPNMIVLPPQENHTT